MSKAIYVVVEEEEIWGKDLRLLRTVEDILVEASIKLYADIM
jgi:hypothetical protein